MIKLVLAMIAVVTVACGGDKKDPYSPFDNDHWLNSQGCSALERWEVAELWSEIADLDRPEREKAANDAFQVYADLPAGLAPDIYDYSFNAASCLRWLSENAD
jgi:hypothetical protein